MSTMAVKTGRFFKFVGSKVFRAALRIVNVVLRRTDDLCAEVNPESGLSPAEIDAKRWNHFFGELARSDKTKVLLDEYDEEDEFSDTPKKVPGLKMDMTENELNLLKQTLSEKAPDLLEKYRGILEKTITVTNRNKTTREGEMSGAERAALRPDQN
jgi:hypothetical protein